MAELEDVAGRGTEGIENAARRRAYRRFGREKRRRIEISLKRDAPGRELTRAMRIARPVESDGADAARHHFGKPGLAAFGEENRRHVERGDEATRIGERERQIVLMRQRAAPGVEDHRHVDTGGDLCPQVIAYGFAVYPSAPAP